VIVILNVLKSGLGQSVVVGGDRRGISVEAELQAQLLDGAGAACSTASGSAFLSPSILGNDSVLYHSLPGLTSPQQVTRSPDQLSEGDYPLKVNCCPMAFLDPGAFVGTNPQLDLSEGKY